MSIQLNSKVPAGSVADKWKKYKAEQDLVNPANKRKLDVIIVGTGLGGAAAFLTDVTITAGGSLIGVSDEALKEF